VSKGVKKILFYGDSYMRHIYAAMLITLSGNYASGSLKDPTSAPECRYRSLFDEKKCNYWNLNHVGWVCGGRILLDPILQGLDLGECEKETGTVNLWSFGNHPFKVHGLRAGVNDPLVYQSEFQSAPCPALKNWASLYPDPSASDVGSKCVTFWLPTHQRLAAHWPDEKQDKVRNYNQQMRGYFENPDNCGPVSYVDIFNMTDGLVQLGEGVTGDLSSDSVHWGFEINLIKAQLLLNGLLQSTVK